jgi:hypothetical protein
MRERLVCRLVVHAGLDWSPKAGHGVPFLPASALESWSRFIGLSAAHASVDPEMRVAHQRSLLLSE